MFKRFIVLLFICNGLWVNSANASRAQHLVWDKTPIHITLPLNQERLIRFPLAISIVDSTLDKEIGIMKTQDTLYLNAPNPFVNKRLVVQLMPEGEVIVLSISATADATDVTPIEVVMAEKEQDQNDRENREDSSIEIPKAAELNPVLLTRFAIQSLYAPERLLVTPPGVTRTAMRTHKNIVMVYGASILARPIISWQGGDLFVTAVELKNALNKRVVINPKQLIGNWQTASFFPSNILEARGGRDTTTVFVVSDRPFGEALSQMSEYVR